MEFISLQNKESRNCKDLTGLEGEVYIVVRALALLVYHGLGSASDLVLRQGFLLLTKYPQPFHSYQGRWAVRWGPGSTLTTACRPQDVFLMIRRHKTTIFTDAKESSTVFELKRIVEGILKRPPDEQRLYKEQLLDDGKTLGECGFTSQTARPQAPATVGLAFRADEAFEALRIEPFSSPPELPDVIKPQDSGSSANEQDVQ
ncbi:elongin-B-like [Orcinus orca]|uniref:elongin-B-like n=1 Tax=Orcinus orca TaxID=9733 RepID=UPI002110F737|nr:elongin-B-like [Orcinus orca]